MKSFITSVGFFFFLLVLQGTASCQQLHCATHQVRRDGCNIHVREYGFPNDRPTIVLMHGFPDSTRLYDRLVSQLMGDRHVIAFDFLGWGDSDKPRNHNYNFRGLELDLDAVVTQLNLQQVLLVVHDASGPTGINWAMANPDKTAGLVLLNTLYSRMAALRAPEEIELFSNPGPRQKVALRITSRNDRFWLRRFRRQVSKFMVNDAVRQQYVEILARQAVNIRPAFYSLNLDLQPELKRNHCKLGQLRQLDVPVRIIFGCSDPYLNVQVAREFHRLIPRSELFLIANAGHYVQLDKPTEVAALIRAFPSPRPFPQVLPSNQ